LARAEEKKERDWFLLVARRAEKERQKAMRNGLAVNSHQSGSRASAGGLVAAIGSQAAAKAGLNPGSWRMALLSFQ
jgi:hypothetical protein